MYLYNILYAKWVVDKRRSSGFRPALGGGCFLFLRTVCNYHYYNNYYKERNGLKVYQKVDPNLDFVEREKQVKEFWKENGIFEKSIDSRREGKSYVFYDGPPTANGKPHIGHVLTRAIKDMSNEGLQSAA